MEYLKDKIQADKKYYSLIFSASPNGQIELGGQTMWVEWADEDHKIELRQFSFVKADRMADYWIEFGIPFCVVNDVDDFAKWYISGGHALVAEEVASQLLPFSLKPSPSVQLGRGGFMGLSIVSESIFKKAPTSKKRMAIIKRDKFKCKVCGRRPDNYVDIELHVHHIRPFGEGGFTHEDNLITLCDTCHNGLDPHYEWSLYDLLEDAPESDIKLKEQKKYFEEVRRYREARKKSV